MVTALFVLAGLGGGYLLWLGVVALIVLTLPVSSWVVASAVALAVIAAAAIVIGRRQQSPAARWAFWSAPALPVLVTGYALGVVLT